MKMFTFRVHSRTGIFTALVLLAGMVSIGFGQGTTRLQPIADAYVRDGKLAQTNYGASATLQVQGGKTDQTADAYLKFNLSSLGDVDQAVLRIFAHLNAGAASVHVRAHAVDDSSWGETTLQWVNRPALGNSLSETTITDAQWNWFQFDVTDYVRSEKAKGRSVISLGLHTSDSLTKYVVANSHEAASNGPELVITRPNHPPTVAISAPSAGQVFTAPDAITVTAAASDPDPGGSITKVVFYADAVKIGEAVASPYTMAWVHPAPGTHTLTAQAIDNLGANTTADPVTLTVVDVDSDYDGRSNWQELQDGTSPFDGESVKPVRLARFGFDTPGLGGEQGQVPRRVQDVAVVPAWSGQALEFTTPSSLIEYRDVEANGQANINCRKGSVRLWFKPNWSSANLGGTGPQTWASLVQVGIYSDPPTIGSWSFGLQPDGNYLHFNAQTNGAHVGYVMGPISLHANTWHQIVLVYGPNQSAVYVDGVQPPLFVDSIPTGRGRGVTVYPGPEVRASYGLYFGTGNRSAPCYGQLDEVETFNYPLTPQTVLAEYPSFGRPDAMLDSDYDGRSDLMETLVDQTNPNDAASVVALRLGQWRFNDASLAGERGQLPFGAGAVTAPSWSGRALSTAAAAANAAVYRDVETSGLANINCQKGSVRLWYKPNWTSGSGPANGRLVEVGGRWSLGITNAGTKLAFHCNQRGRRPPELAASIQWTPGRWHQVVLTYDALETRLYVDGELAPGSPGTGVLAYPAAEERTNTFAIGASCENTSPMDGLLDELETFNYVLSAGEIATNFLFYRAMDRDLNGVPDTVEDPVLPQSEPFTQAPFVVTGAIEAEQFDQGGQGIAYSSGAANPPNDYRVTGLAIEPCNDLGGGYCLTRLKQGDWVQYTFVVQAPGYYTFEARLAPCTADASGATWEFEIAQANGAAPYLSEPLTVAVDGWHNVGTSGVYLPAGTNTFKLRMLQNGTDGFVGRFNYISVYPAVSPNGFPAYTATATLVTTNIGQDLATAQANSRMLQAAVDNVFTHGGGTVFIPAGTYVLAQQKGDGAAWEAPQATGAANAAVILLKYATGNSLGSNIRISGDPNGGTVLVSHNRATTLFWMPNWFGYPQTGAFRNVTFEHLTLKGRPHTLWNGQYEPGWFFNDAAYAGAGSLIVAGTVNERFQNLHIHDCHFVNPSVCAIILCGVENVLIERNEFECLNGEVPDGEPVQYNAQLLHPQTRVLPTGGIGVFGSGTPNHNVVVIDNIYDGRPGLTTDQADVFSMDGLVWFQSGGNWFVSGNIILHYGLEAVQFNGGPGAVVGNVFETTQRCGSTCALCLSGTWATLSGRPLDRTYGFIGNTVSGGRSAVVSAYKDYQYLPDIHLNLHVGGNSVYLYPPGSQPYEVPPALLNLFRCDRVNVSGNTLLAADFALRSRYGDISAELRNNDFTATAVAPLDFQGSEDALERVIITQNRLGSSWGDHVRLNWYDAFKFFFIRNTCFDATGAPAGVVTDPVGAPVHVSE